MNPSDYVVRSRIVSFGVVASETTTSLLATDVHRIALLPQGHVAFAPCIAAV